MQLGFLELAGKPQPTDFRKKFIANDVPILILHGENGSGVPAEISGRATAKLVRNAKYVEFAGQSHALVITHHVAINAELIDFLMSHMAI